MSPGYDAVTEPVPKVDPMNVELHVADAVVPDRLQGLKEPVTPLTLKDTVPVGVMNVPSEVSVTVTVHVDAWFIVTVDGLHATDVVVVRSVTVSMNVPLLPVWVVSVL